MVRFSVGRLAASLAFLIGAAGAQAQTLDAVKARGALTCGVNQGLAGFGIADAKGEWSGFDVDFCRAVAAAVLGDAKAVRFVPLSASERFDALREGKVDLLSRNTTWTMGRETELGLTFAGATYYDGQGFLVAKKRNAVSALELSGVKVCAQPGTTTIANVRDYFAANAMTLELVEAANPAAIREAYEAGRCDAITSDVSQLYAERLALKNPTDHAILPDVISKEPLGPVVRASDVSWTAIVRWVHFALINAEELGVGMRNVDEALASSKPDVKRLVGTDGRLGESMGLQKDWAAKAVRAVGHYGEMFERNLGANSPLSIPRGLNQLWSMGGIQYAPPIR
jgi:general L-amino acid transport system substrate-binding protein